MKSKDYMTKLVDGTFLVNSRFKFDSIEDVHILFPELMEEKSR